VNGKLKNLLKGAMAGAAGTTALNAVGYGDMALRGRPASSTPDQVVEQLATRLGLTIPGLRRSRRAAERIGDAGQSPASSNVRR
jgi:hypothetical protein